MKEKTPNRLRRAERDDAIVKDWRKVKPTVKKGGVTMAKLKIANKHNISLSYLTRILFLAGE